jgi:hypothetical protein
MSVRCKIHRSPDKKRRGQEGAEKAEKKAKIMIEGLKNLSIEELKIN